MQNENNKPALQADLTAELISKAVSLLKKGKAQSVVGWRRGLFDSDITPGVFTDADDLTKHFVYNKYCGANLSKYLVRLTHEIEIKKSTTRVTNELSKKRDPASQDAPIPAEVIAAFLKPCDTYSFAELLKEHRITRDDVYVVGIPCDGMADPESGKILERCSVCKSVRHVIYDELIGEEGDVLDSARYDEVRRLEAMSEEERYNFWRRELSRCIRCNACRNVCPACTCEKCVFDNNAMYTSQKVAATSFEENLFHIIRAWHVAGRCTDCGECSRVCPEHIPLHLLNRKFCKDIDELYGPYIAGSDTETRPPMLRFDAAHDAEPSVIYERDATARGGK